MIEYDPMRTAKGRIVKKKPKAYKLIANISVDTAKLAKQLGASMERMNKVFSSNVEAFAEAAKRAQETANNLYFKKEEADHGNNSSTD